MKAKKALGQHFLRSDRALKAIVNAAEVNADDIVLEIGPGKGALTERLMIFAAKVIAIEKDDGLYKELQEKFKEQIDSGRLDLIHGDALEFNPSVLTFYNDFEFVYKIAANIPYNITGAILRKFLSADYQPETMVLMVQKEVAERIVGERGRRASTKESILSISVKAYGKPRYVETVKAGSFAPAPKVDSAILAIEKISKNFFAHRPGLWVSEEKFFEMVRAGFSSKRKKLSSNLSALYPKEKVEEAFEEIGLDKNARAEDLDIHLWGRIGQKLL